MTARRESGVQLDQDFRLFTGGFTLVEVIVAIAVGSVVVSLLATSLWMVVRFHDASIRDTDERNDTLDRLRLCRFLGSAVPEETNLGGTGVLTLNRIKDSQCLSVRISPGGFRMPGEITDPCRLELTAGAMKGVHLVISPIEPVPADAGSAGSGAPTVRRVLLERQLFPGNDHCTIEVLGSDGGWHSEWPPESTTDPPCAVRFHFTRSPPHNGLPDILVRIPAVSACDGTGNGIAATSQNPESDRRFQ